MGPSERGSKYLDWVLSTLIGFRSNPSLVISYKYFD